jgi:hypothetical protein
MKKMTPSGKFTTGKTIPYLHGIVRVSAGQSKRTFFHYVHHLETYGFMCIMIRDIKLKVPGHELFLLGKEAEVASLFTSHLPAGMEP